MTNIKTNTKLRKRLLAMDGRAGLAPERPSKLRSGITKAPLEKRKVKRRAKRKAAKA